MDGLSPKSKKIKFVDHRDYTANPAEEHNRRSQVDAHVQAFLKAVLDHAQNSSIHKSGRFEKFSGKLSKSLRDASTQTDKDLGVCIGYEPACVSLNNSTDSLANTGTYNNAPNCALNRVPNKEMYSQEALDLFSQQRLYNNQIQEDLSVNDVISTQYYSNRKENQLIDSYAASKGHRISSTKMRKAINQWVKSYEEWFYRNFGMDIRTASYVVKSQLDSSLNQSTLNYSHQTPEVHTSASDTSTEITTILSHSPVSYVVSEGSLCVVDNQFSPYFSLIPSFYTSSAFKQATQRDFVTTFSPLNFDRPMQLPPGRLCGVTCFPVNMDSDKVAFPTQPVVSQTPHSTQVPPILSPLGFVPEISTNNFFTINPRTSFADLPNDLQTSAMLATLALPISDGENSLGQWGPHLKYGTYGRLPSLLESSLVNSQRKSYESTFCVSMTDLTPPLTQSKSLSPLQVVNEVQLEKMPPPPPTFLLLRRQAMICALQLSCRDRGQQLFLKEKDLTGTTLDYAYELEQVTNSTVSLTPVYIFTQLKKLPARELSHFMGSEFIDHEKQLRSAFHPCQDFQLACDSASPSYQTSCLFACDLLIGDVLIAISLSTSKSQARSCAAKQAFHILSKPCFLVGSIRQWEAVEYLVLCLSPMAELVPKLPPFLKDPFDPSLENTPPQSDVSIDVVNPKPVDDMWIYLADLPIEILDQPYDVTRILAQSAEFSQMEIAFEVEVHTNTGHFKCHALVDGQRCLSIESSSLIDAHKSTTEELLKWLRTTQPIVGLKPCSEGLHGSEPKLPLWGVTETFLIDSLMWGKEELDIAIRFEQLEAHCGVPDLTFASQNNESIDQYLVQLPLTSSHLLDHYLQTYAASALVTPLRIDPSVVPTHLWSAVRNSARRWGLLSCIKTVPETFLLVCKQVPLPRLKRSLFDRGEFGCFQLLSRGNLSQEALRCLALSDPLPENLEHNPTPYHLNQPFTSVTQLSPICSPATNEPNEFYADDPIARLAREFQSSGQKFFIKSEPTDAGLHLNSNEDCVLLAAELNQPSNAIEILDDLPKTLIPGIDF